MKKKLVVFIILCSNIIYGQYTLSTQDGKTVYLNADGTWTYKKEDSNISNYVSKKQNFILQYDNTLWQTETDSKWDFELASKSGVITARFHENEIHYKKETVRDIIAEQYKNTGKIKDFVVTEQLINGMQMLYFKFSLVYIDTKFTYSGVAFSGENGSCQLIAGGQEWLHELNDKRIETLFNGLRKNY